PLVDRVVADRLADQVVRDRPDAEVELLQHLALAGDVGVVLQGLVHLEVVAPAGDLEAVVAPLGGEPAHLLERQVRPLSGEQGHWPGAHASSSISSTLVQRLPSAALRSTAASTFCTRRPSANDGAGSVPAAIASRKSFISWVKVWS